MCIFSRLKEKKRLKEEARQQEEARLQQEQQKALEEEYANYRAKIKEIGYDHAYHLCKTSDDFELFWGAFLNDFDFWGGDIYTVFGEPNGSLRDGKNYPETPYTFIEELEKLYFNKENPFVQIIRNFLAQRPSQEIKINEGYWLALHDYIFSHAPDDELELIRFASKIAKKFMDYKVFLLDYYEFGKYIKNL